MFDRRLKDAPPSGRSGDRDATATPRAGMPMFLKTRTSAIQFAPDGDAAPQPVSTALIVDDNATDVAAGQMRKSEFVSQAKAAMTAAAEGELAGTPWAGSAASAIDGAAGSYAGQPAASLEQSIRSSAPGAAGATSAADLIPPLCARTLSEIRARLQAASPASIAASAIGAVGDLASSAANMLFKEAPGRAASPSASPQHVAASLGPGSPLESSARTRMESAFGADFSGVRTHTDQRGGAMADQFHARAFTVGDHVAFSSGEYAPGTPIGDALLAHELVHVLQQQNGSVPAQVNNSQRQDIEEDADRSAIFALAKSWFGGAVRLGQEMLPRLRTGLKLSRCSKDENAKPEGIQYDEARDCTMGSPGSGVKKAYPSASQDESATHDDITKHLTKLNAGGVYVFYGHGAYTKDTNQMVGINPTKGHTVKGDEIEKALAKDSDPPTMVVLGACGSEAILGNVTNGGVPVAVGLSDKVANAAGAAAVSTYMSAVSAGKTFGEAQQEANDLLGRSPIGGGVELVVHYADGFDASMTLAQAQAKQKSAVGATP